MKVVRKITDLRRAIAEIKRKGKIIALVPTMGALHNGHLSLVETARKKADFVVVSIFVNPAQFAPTEDFSHYPRTERADLEKLAGKADLVFIPDAREIYLVGFSTHINVGEIGEILEGKFRPGFFAGVATVVAKLFNMVEPDIAVFGEKDYQQLQMIKNLARDLNFPVKILAGKTCREKDGLAMSSRNCYLTAEEREIAPLLYEVLRECAAKIKSGRDAKKSITVAKKKLIAGGFNKIDYLEIMDNRLLAAVWLGKTRLIDNLEFSTST